MDNTIAELREAINSQPQEQEKIKMLMGHLSPDQINDFLRSKQNDKTTLEHIFSTCSKDIGFILLAKSQQKYYNDTNEFTWLKLFDLLEDFFLSQKKRYKKITAQRLASRLSFLSRYKEEIDVQSLIKRPKFFIAALLLGAKSNQKGERWVFDCVMKSDLKSKPKKDLIAWLLDNKFINNKSVSVKLLSEILKTKSISIAELLVKHFPSMLEDTDEEGHNLMHFCLPNEKGVRMRMFNRCMDFVSSHATEDQFYKILTARSRGGIVTVISIIQQCFRISYFHVHNRVIQVLGRLAREGKQDILTQLYNGTKDFYQNFVLKAFLIQSGMNIDFHHFTCMRKDVRDLSQILWFVKGGNSAANSKKLTQFWNQKNKTIPSNINSNKNNTNYISLIPNEILSLIMVHLEPHDLANFSMSCKSTTEFFATGFNEVFWKEYSARNFAVETRNWQGPSFKTKFVQETKGLLNWRKKKYSTITIEGKTPLLMDENWLLLESSMRNFYYWNCHTQDQCFQKPPLGTYAKPLALLSTYSVGHLPPVIYTRLPYSDGKAPRFAIRSGGEDVVPSNAKKFLKEYGSYDVDLVKPIDHRVLINKDAYMYNVETDQFILPKIDPGPFISRFSGVCVNPFNRTFTKIGSRNTLEVYNYQYELLSTIPVVSGFDYSILEAADEHTLFFQEYSNSAPNGFIDLRMGKILWSEGRLLPMRHEHLPYAVSSTRIVVKGDHTSLLASFHLPSQKFEWSLQSDVLRNNYDSLTPVAVNKRYVASQHQNTTVVFDFCHDL